MQVLRFSVSSKLAIPVNKIDFINWEESSGGKAIMKIGTGGHIHNMEYPTLELVEEAYEKLLDLIEEL